VSAATKAATVAATLTRPLLRTDLWLWRSDPSAGGPSDDSFGGAGKPETMAVLDRWWKAAPVEKSDDEVAVSRLNYTTKQHTSKDASLVIDASASPNESHTLSGGVGAMSTAGTSRLLIDYAEPYRSQVLDYLFLPGHGASLQHLKVSLGGDGECTSGSEPSTMHNATAEDYGVGYELWLMAEARKRNPDIVLYGLPLSWPAWVGNGAASPFADVALPARYVTKWCSGAKRVWNVSVDYIGLWNERPCKI